MSDRTAGVIIGVLLGIFIGLFIAIIATNSDLAELETLRKQRVVCPMCEGRGVVELPKVEEPQR